MTWKKLGSFGVTFVLLLSIGSTIATGHEKHRKSAPVAESDMPKEPLAAAKGQSGPAPEPDQVAGSVSSAATGPPPAPQALAPSELPPESVSLLSWLGRLHPMAVHFPIALFLVALVAELLFAATQAALFRHALRFSLWCGAIGAVAATPLGWLFAASGATEEGWLLEAHRWAGTSAMLLGLVVLWIGERTERAHNGRLLLRVSLALQALLIGTVGHLGGSLLYGFDHLWRGL
jgi:uncharacterized membrane protein